MGDPSGEFAGLSGFDETRFLITEAYLPFADVDRVIPWPGQEGRLENDAEHSFSLAFVASLLGRQLGLDPAKIALYATFHDFVERYAATHLPGMKKGLRRRLIESIRRKLR